MTNQSRFKTCVKFQRYDNFVFIEISFASAGNYARLHNFTARQNYAGNLQHFASK